MIIQSLHIEKFGKWSGLRLQNLEPGVNLFYGPNETGKTTLMQFIRTIFYGFSDERLAYAYQEEPEKTGGSMTLLTHQGILNAQRHLVSYPAEISENSLSTGKTKLKSSSPNQRYSGKNVFSGSSEISELPFFSQLSFRERFRTRNIEDGLILTNDKGIRQDIFQWKELLELSGDHSLRGETASLEMDEILFNSIFALGLQELQKLSVLDSTEAAKRLYDLSTGITRYSLGNILMKLQQARERILPPGEIPEILKTEDLQWCGKFFSPMLLKKNSEEGKKRVHAILELWNYRQLLLKQQENTLTQNKQYQKIHSELTCLENDSKKLEEDIQQQKHKLRIFEIASNIQSFWEKRADIDAKIVEFGASTPELTDFSDRKIEILSENREKLAKIRRETNELKQKRSELRSLLEELKQKKESISLNLPLIQKAPVLETFFQQQEWIETLRGRLDDLYRQQMDSEAQLTIDYRRLGIQLPDFSKISPEQPVEEIFPYDIRTLRSLKTPSIEMKRIRKQIHAVRKRRFELLRKAEEFSLKIGACFRACQERTATHPEVQTLPGMTGFPQIFLLNTTESLVPQAAQNSQHEKNRALNALNSNIVREIPEEILASGKNPKALPQETPSFEKNANPPQMDINAAARFLGEVLGAGRRSEIHLQQLNQALVNLAKYEKEKTQKSQRQILSIHELALRGGLFTFGLTLVLFELLRLTGLLGNGGGIVHFLFFLLGFVMCLGTFIWQFAAKQKLNKEFLKLDDSLENAYQQRDRLLRLTFEEREREIAKLSSDELLELTKEEMTKLILKMEFLENELKEMETASSAQAQKEALLKEAEHHAERLRKLRENFIQAQKRREKVLISLNLPENWKTSNIRHLIDAADRIRELWRRRSRDLEDFTLYSQELKLLVERLENLLPLFGKNCRQELKGNDERFPFINQVFSEMKSRLENEITRGKEAEMLEKKIAEIRSRLRKINAEGEKKHQIRAKILELSEIQNEKALQTALEKLSVIQELRAKRRELQKTIDQALDFSCSESMLWEVYEKHSPEQILEKKKILTNALAENEFQLASAQKRSLECRAIIEKIIADDSPIRIQFELSRTNAQIGHAVNSWRVFAMTQRLIETILKTYQQKRQPRTLERASRFMRQMTDGKYERVWTPIDEDLLFIQRTDGHIFSTEQLSMGTKELLYLAIRLALAEEYRQQNMALPIILDDVLVNFDRQRAAAAAKVLTEFADQDNQILFFTSHEHIREIFMKENALICDMEKN